MPRSAYLSERAVTRWMRGTHPSPGAAHYDDLARRLAATLGDEGRALAFECDVMAGEVALELHEQLLFYVGTLLMQRGHEDVWRTIYSATTEDDTVSAEQFLTDTTAAVRRKER